MNLFGKSKAIDVNVDKQIVTVEITPGFFSRTKDAYTESYMIDGRYMIGGYIWAHIEGGEVIGRSTFLDKAYDEARIKEEAARKNRIKTS